MPSRRLCPRKLGHLRLDTVAVPVHARKHDAERTTISRDEFLVLTVVAEDDLFPDRKLMQFLQVFGVVGPTDQFERQTRRHGAD